MLNSLTFRIRNSFLKPMKEKVFFLHIPKCGGNSIKDALRKQFISLDMRKDSSFAYINTNYTANIISYLREESSEEFKIHPDCSLRIPEYLLMYYMSQPKVRCIAGHVPFCNIAYHKFKNKYAYITIMRDPVTRWISEYYYNKRNSRVTSDMEIYEYIESEYGRAQGTEYVLFLGGRSNGNDHYSSKAVKRAIKNLSYFSVIGFLEDLNAFTGCFHQRFGVMLDVGKKNITPPIRNRSEITNDIRQRIETICERDLEIYHNAKKLML